MCYDSNAQPPEPLGVTGTAQGEELVLTAQDGNHFAAYIAQPSQPTGAQVIIYPDVRGLHQFYKELALRFAKAGVLALGLDYFGRTAGLTPRDDSFEFWPHVQQLQLANFFLDVEAALGYLASRQAGKGTTFTVGFCMGGSLSLLTGTRDLAVNGVIAFYAGLSRAFGGGKTVLEQAETIHYPVLGLFGGADQGIPVSDVEQLGASLEKAGVEHTLKIYPGAPHSFFDRRAVDHAEASNDAWKQVLGFIASHNA